MNRPTIKEINYADFKRVLQRAVAGGRRVEAADRDRWTAFVAQHRVKEAGFSAYAKNYSDTLKPVIIDDSEPDGGYYLYSERDEVCLKWIPRAI
jgi:hypothetical protein